MRKQILSGQHAALSGRIKCLIMQGPIIVKEFPWQKNLFLNQGMDNVGNGTCLYADSFLWCAKGTGVTATSAASGVTTAAFAAGQLTLVGGSYTWTGDANVGAGSFVKLTSGADSGNVFRITSITNATQAQAVLFSGVDTGAAGTFNVYYCQQTGLTTASGARINANLFGAGNCETQLTTGSPTTYRMRRTYDFPIEAGPITYGEVGFSHTSIAGGNLNVRIALSPTVALTANQNLRVIYDLTLTLTPDTNNARDLAGLITGWPVAPSVNLLGTETWQQVGLSSVRSSDGSTQSFDNAVITMEPGFVSSGGFPVQVFCSEVSTAANAPFNGGPIDRTTGQFAQNAILSTYTNGAFNFFRDKSAVIPSNIGNSALIRSMGLGFSAGIIHPYNTGQGIIFVFTQNQTKDTLHSLTLTWRNSWSRTLT